jgi:hypothetical protein
MALAVVVDAMTTSRSLERRGDFTLACITALVVIALAMWFIAINAAAAEVATDNELYAAYCIGVLQKTQQAQRKAVEEFAETLADDKQLQDKVRREGQEPDKDLDQKLARFRTYLAVRGFRPAGGRDAQAFTAIQVALQRGRADHQRCSQFRLAKKTAPHGARARGSPQMLLSSASINAVLKIQRANHPSAVFKPITSHFRWPRKGPCAIRRAAYGWKPTREPKSGGKRNDAAIARPPCYTPRRPPRA